jgi:hypothetical protein
MIIFLSFFVLGLMASSTVLLTILSFKISAASYRKRDF